MKLYRCVYQMGVETALEYRANMVLTLLSTIFPIIIQTFLWNYLYGNGDAGAMTGYSYTEIIVYTLLAGLVSKLVITGFEYQINEDIKDGGLNKYLIRPVNYCGYRFCSYLGEKMPQLILLLICTSVLVAFSSIFLGLKLSLVRIVLFLVGLVLAVILNFFIFYCVALLSFWLTDVHLLFGTVTHAPKTDAGGGPGTQKHIRTTPRKAPRTREANDLFHTSTPTPDRRRSPARGPHDGRQTIVLKNSVERR